jgi:hypothetical protein
VKIGPRDLNLTLLLFYEFPENRLWQGLTFLMVVNGLRFGVYCESYAILSAKNTFVKSTVSGSAPFAVLQYLCIEIYVLGARCKCRTLNPLFCA